jgi:hypothetical protein
MTAFVVNVKIGAFKWKLEFWKTFTCPWELDSFPMRCNFPHDITRNINKCDLEVLCNEIWQNLEDLHNNVLGFL